MNPDVELLRRYVEFRSEESFAELVRRHLNLVYFAALRRTSGNAALAEDIAQDVFTALARQAAGLVRHETLAGWLYTTTRNVAAKAARAEHRRKLREQEAQTMNELFLDPDGSADWEKLRPVLDAALDELSDGDREAVLMRCLQNRPFAEIGVALRVSEDAARMRVERALEKLHLLLARRGVTSTASALAAVLANQAVAVAPAGLAASVTGAALSGGAAGVGFVVAVFQFMNATKVSLALAAGAVAVGVAVHQETQARAATSAVAEARRVNAALNTRLAELETNVSAAEKERAERETAMERLRSEKSAAAAKPAAAAPVDDINARFREIFNRLTQNDAERWRASQNKARFTAQATFRPLFKSLGFTPEQIEQALEIVSPQWTENGVATNTNPVARFREVFGDAAAERFTQYRRDGGARDLVNDFSAKVYFADAPFTAQQTERLTQIVRETNAEGAPERSSFENAAAAFRRTRDWDRILSQAQSFASPQQLQALRALAALAHTEAQLAVAATETAARTK